MTALAGGPAATATAVKSGAARRDWIRPAVALAVAVGWVLRLWEINGLRVYGDGAYSLYLAGLPPHDLIRLTAGDSHPPLYYLVLWALTGLAGAGELAARWPGIAAGTIAVPLTYVAGARAFNRPAGAVTAWLVALSPFLIYYARFPRMYALVVAVALLAGYLLSRAIGGDRRWWIAPAFGLTLWLAVHLHYFGAVFGLSAGVVVLVAWRRGNPAAPRLLLAGVVAALATVPWVGYGFLGAAAFTASNIANAPPPAGPLGFAEQFSVPYLLGPLIDRSVGRPIFAVVALVLIGLVAAVARRGSRVQSPGALVVAALLIVPVVLSIGIFIFFPAFGRSRFLAFVLPFGLIWIGAGLVAAWRRSRPIAVAVAAVWLVATGWALADAYRVEPSIYEPDPVRLTAILEEYARPGDLVVFQAAWQFGYLRAHYRGPAIVERDLATFAGDSLPATLAEHPRIWLAMYRRGVRDPDFPIEAALDRSLAKVVGRDLVDNRIALYTRPPAEPPGAVGADFLDPATNRPAIRLESVRLPDLGSLTPSRPIPIELTWRSLAPVEPNLSVFLHLDSPDGRTWAGRDAEPLDGLAPTSTWRPGDTIGDRRGLIVPAETPPGDYRLTLGLYAPDGRRWPAASGEAIELGRVRVGPLPAAGAPPPERPVDARFGQAIRLTGADAGGPSPRPADRAVRDAYLDNPAVLLPPSTTYRPGDSIDLRLFWTADAPVGEDLTVFVHLIDGAERPVAQRDNPPGRGAYPTGRWQPGTAIVDPYQLTLPPDLPPGRYRLIAGLYRPATGDRLPVRTGGSGRADNRVTLDTVTVEAGRP